VRAISPIFGLLGFGFASWLSRLPSVRDQLGASTLEMSYFGLVLALGSLTGLVFSGRVVSWLGPKRALAMSIIGQGASLPAAVVMFWIDATPLALIGLAIYGYSFSTADVALNVSAAEAERAIRKPKMTGFHAAYSLGSVTAMGVGALAEAAGIAAPLHLSFVFIIIVIGVLFALRAVPRISQLGEAAEHDPHASVHTGPIPVIRTAPPLARNYSPWRDPRVLIIGLIAMSISLAEGTASDWLPIALVDGRGFSNETAALTLGVFFISMTIARFAGSWLLTRFGRVAVLRGGAILTMLGIGMTILVPIGWVSAVAAVLWGVGCAFGFPIGVSAAADRPQTAIRDVAAVSAIAYTAYLLGPMMIGFLGDIFGLLSAFWVLIVFSLVVVVFAGWAREPGRASRSRT
jgi:predicted MFS family arabinose efflux permease